MNIIRKHSHYLGDINIIRLSTNSFNPSIEDHIENNIYRITSKYNPEWYRNSLERSKIIIVYVEIQSMVPVFRQAELKENSDNKQTINNDLIKLLI